MDPATDGYAGHDECAGLRLEQGLRFSGAPAHSITQHATEMPDRDSRLTVVVTLEGLSTAPISCYGCSWNETPAFDSLAAGGIVWDRWTTPLDRPGELVERWLSTSAEAIRQARSGGTTQLISDDARLPLADLDLPFDGLTHFEGGRAETPAVKLEQTAIARLAAAALEQCVDETRLLWLHSAFLRDVWDAPNSSENGEREP